MKKENLKNYAIALCEAVENVAPEKMDQIIGNFLKLLARKNKLKKMDQIISEIENYEKQKRGVKTVEIISARKFSGEIVEQIKNIFEGEVEIKETVDQNLLGGLKIKIEDKILDASIAKKISKMKQTLTI